MGRQSSRIIWGKTQKNPDESGYNLVYITDYDPENIYTSGNIVIAPETSYGAVEEDYKAWQCVASEAAGEFASWDESIWKELKGIKPIGKVVYVPDTEAQQIINPKRNIYRPGAKIIKLDKNGNHYLYKCIQENNIQIEGWVPSKWEVQMQRVGVAWIPRDHKDVYYNGKYHWAMWMMPEEFDDTYGEEISLYDPEVQYFKNEYCICPADEEGNRPLKLYKYVSQYPGRGIFPPYNSSLEPDESGTWMEMKNVSEHIDHQELGTYPKDTKIIYEEYNQEEVPVSDFVAGREYDKTRNHTCLHLIKPMGGSVSDKDHEILTATGDYTRTASGSGYDYTPVTDYAKKIEGNYPIYGYYEIDENAPDRFIDSYFDIDHWHLKTMIKQREGYSIRIAIKEWSLVTSRDEGYEYGDIVIFSIPNSDAYGVYTCSSAHHADRPTYLPTEVPESYNSGTLDAKQPTDTHYWRLRKETYIDRGIHLYKSVRLTAKYNLNRKDWVVQTQNKHCDLEAGDEVWGFIWKKYGWSSGGNPFYFPMLIPSVNLSSGNYYFKRCRLCSFYPFMGDNVLELTSSVFESGYHSDKGERYYTGTYVDTMHATATGIFAYGFKYLYGFFAILLWQGNKNWKIYRLDDYYEPDTIGAICFYGQNTVLIDIIDNENDTSSIIKMIFMGDTVVNTKIAEVDHSPGPQTFHDGYVVSYNKIYEEHTYSKEVSGEVYTVTLGYTFSDIYTIDINGNIAKAVNHKRVADGYASSSLGVIPIDFTNWDMYDYISSYCRIVEKPYNASGFIYIGVDVYDIKTQLLFISHSVKQGVITGYSNQYFYTAEEESTYESYLGDSCYVMRKSKYCFINPLKNIIVYFKTTITQVMNGQVINTRTLMLANNPAEGGILISDPEEEGINIDGIDLIIDDSQIGESTPNPVTNVLDIGNFLWKSNGLYYFADNRMERYYNETTGELTAYQLYKTCGVWELNMSAASANLVVDLSNVDTDYSWVYYKQVLLWNAVLKIPYYGNQICNVNGLSLQYLYIGYNIVSLYNKFPDEYEEVAILVDNFSPSTSYYAIKDNKVLIPWSDLETAKQCGVKCSADTGYPLQGDQDLVASIYVEFKREGSIWKDPCEIILVLPNFYSIQHYASPRGYDPITNGAFFWLVEGLNYSNRISPTYGGPEQDAQGFNGW